MSFASRALAGSLLVALAAPAFAQTPSAPADTALDHVKDLVGRLELERYKATIKGLTQFGDRRQGTARNRAAVDWIEAQLKSYGCADVARIVYTYTTPQRNGGRGAAGDTTGRGGRGAGRPRSDYVSGARVR